MGNLNHVVVSTFEIAAVVRIEHGGLWSN